MEIGNCAALLDAASAVDLARTNEHGLAEQGLSGGCVTGHSEIADLRGAEVFHDGLMGWILKSGSV
jgi:hypothetical protein